LTPITPKPLTNSHKVSKTVHVSKSYLHAKFPNNSSRGLFTPCVRLRASTVTQLVYCFFQFSRPRPTDQFFIKYITRHVSIQWFSSTT